jgi:predicted dehydrogenase
LISLASAAAHSVQVNSPRACRASAIAKACASQGSRNTGVRLVAVVDRDLERARAIAAEHGCEAHADSSAILGRVAAASVAVPTIHHRAVAEQLLSAGIDVLVEKPIAASLEEADSILAAGRASGRIVMVGHTERFNPAILALASVVDKPRFLEIHRLAGFSARSTDVDVILDLMIHDLELLLHLDGAETVAVDAVGVAALTDKVDIANARIRLASGCVANLTASRVSSETLRRVRVFQARSYVACDTVARTVEEYRVVPGPDGAPAIRRSLLPVEDGEPLAIELRTFIDCVRSRAVPPVDGEHGRRALELAHRVREAVDAGTPGA